MKFFLFFFFSGLTIGLKKIEFIVSWKKKGYDLLAKLVGFTKGARSTPDVAGTNQ